MIINRIIVIRKQTKTKGISRERWDWSAYLHNLGYRSLPFSLFTDEQKHGMPSSEWISTNSFEIAQYSCESIQLMSTLKSKSIHLMTKEQKKIHVFDYK